MADELQLHYVCAGTPEQVIARWRAEPPRAITHDRFTFKVEDEAYNAITYVAHYYDWPQKVMIGVSLGFALIWRGFLRSTFRITARFDAEGATMTKVTLLGQAHPRTRHKLAELAAENGGAVGLRVGV